MSQLYLNKILSITKLQTCGSGLLLKLQRHTLRFISVFYCLHIYIFTKVNFYFYIRYTKLRYLNTPPQVKVS